MSIATICVCGMSLNGFCSSSVKQCKLLKMSGGYAPGNYQCHCGTCGGGFKGDKRSYQCEPCALNDRAKFDALSPSEQEELMKRNAQAMNEMFSKVGTLTTESPAEQPLCSDLAIEAKEHAKTVTNNPEHQLYVAQGYYNAMLKKAEQPVREVDDWISVDDRPLKRQEGDFWELTEDGEKEFIAAVPYHDRKSDDPGRIRWWIRHCYIDNEGYLYVKRDDPMDEDVAGWAVSDITHWKPLPEPPAEWSGEKVKPKEAVVIHNNSDAFRNWVSDIKGYDFALLGHSTGVWLPADVSLKDFEKEWEAYEKANNPAKKEDKP